MGELSVGAISGIVLVCAAVVCVIVVVVCVVRSRTVRKQRKFEHRFRGTIRDDPDLKLTSLSRFSAPGKKNNANTNHYVSAIYDPNTLPQITFTSDSVLDPPYHRDDKQIWRFPEQNSLNNQLQRPTSFLEQNKGYESPRILRDNRPPKPLPRNLYSQVQPRGTKLYRSNSDCSSVMSYDLGDPRNSPAFPRHSSLYIPTRGHRPRAETVNSARSSAIGMDLGEGVPKAWMMLDNDYFRKHSITRL